MYPEARTENVQWKQTEHIKLLVCKIWMRAVWLLSLLSIIYKGQLMWFYPGNSLEVSQKVKIELPYDPAIAL